MMLIHEMPVLVPVSLWPNEDQRHWQFFQDWEYAKWTEPLFVEQGFIFNGANIPRPARVVMSSTGILFLGSVFHDYAYQNEYLTYLVQVPLGLKKEKKKVTRKEADEIFEEICKIHYPEHKELITQAVNMVELFGGVAWDRCREERERLLGNVKESFDVTA